MAGPWEDTLAEHARQAPVQDPLKDFVIRTLLDPNPLHRAGLPLGLLGRGLEASHTLGEAGAGLLTGIGEGNPQTFRNWLAGPEALQKQWDDNWRSDVPVLGGVVGSLLDPTNALTMGAKPLALAGKGAQALVPGIERFAPLAKPLVATNKGADWAGQKTWDVLAKIGSKGASTLKQVAPSWANESAESAGRKLHATTLNFFDTLTRNNALPRATDLARYKIPAGMKWAEHMGGELAKFEQRDVGADPVQQLTKAMLLEDITQAASKMRRNYEVERHGLEAAQDFDGLEDAGAELHRGVIGLIRAAEHTLDDMARAPRTGPLAMQEGFDSQYFAELVRDRLETWSTRRNDLLQRYQVARGIEKRHDFNPDLDPDLYQQRDAELKYLQGEMVGDLQRAFDDYLKTLPNALSDDETPSFLRAYLDPEVAREFRGRLQSVRMGERGLPVEGAPFVPTDMENDLLMPYGATILKQHRKLTNDKQKVMTALADALEAKPGAGGVLKEELLADRNDTTILAMLKSMGVVQADPEVLTSTELLQGLRDSLARGNRIFNAEDQARITTILERYNNAGIDLLHDDARHLAAREIQAKAISERPDQASWRPGKDSWVRKQVIDPSVDLWRTNALTSVVYPLRNAIGGMYNHAAGGYSDELPAIMRGLTERLMNWLRHPGKFGENWITKHQRAFQDAYEHNYPHQLVSSQADANLSALGEGKQLSTSRYSALHRAVLGAAMGGFHPVTGTIGAASGLLAPHMERITKLVTHGLETELRGVRYENEFAKRMTEEAPEFLRQLREQIVRGWDLVHTGPTEFGPNQDIVRILPEPREIKALDAVLGDLADGAFGPRKLTESLNSLGRIVDEDTLNKFGKAWVNLQQQAERQALDSANALHFDYSTKSKLEETLHQFAPFMTWGMRATPQFVERVLTNPALATGLVHYLNLSGSEVEKAGLPKSYYGTVPMRDPVSRWIGGLMAGRPVDALWVNPMAAGLPLADLGGSIGRASTTDNPLEMLGDLARGAGLSPAGPYSLMGSIVAGGDDPTPNILRHTNLLSGLPGLLPAQQGGWLARWMQVDQPGAIDYLRRALGQDPYLPLNDKVSRRLDELSMERTGQVGNAEFMAAKANRDAPLYQEALGEVLRQQFGSAMSSMVNPMTTRPVTTTEAAIRKEHQNYPQGAIDTDLKREQFAAAKQSNPVGGAYTSSGGWAGGGTANRLKYLQDIAYNPMPLVPGATPEMGQLWSLYRTYQQAAAVTGQPIQRVAPGWLMQSPLLRQMLSARDAALADPLYQQYTAWKQQFHPDPRGEGEESLIAQFLNRR